MQFQFHSGIVLGKTSLHLRDNADRTVVAHVARSFCKPWTWDELIDICAPEGTLTAVSLCSLTPSTSFSHSFRDMMWGQ